MMKKAILLLGILSTAFAAYAGCEGEAQVIGHVASAKAGAKAGTCLVQFKEIVANANLLCPLTTDDILNHDVEVPSDCSVVNSWKGEVSGYVVIRKGSLVLE